MPDLGTDLEQLEFQLSSLEDNLAATSQMAAVFQNELSGMQTSISLAEREARGFSRSLSKGLRGALGDVILEGAKFSDVLSSLGQRMIRSTFNQALSPVTDALSSFVTGGIGSILGGILPFQKGGVLASGRVQAFAKGGVVSGATAFPMRGGMGLMGEAGPEAIMPLARGADGALGVRAQSTQPITVHMHITTPDVAGFQRSQTQVAAGVSRALSRSQRNQ